MQSREEDVSFLQFDVLAQSDVLIFLSSKPVEFVLKQIARYVAFHHSFVPSVISETNYASRSSAEVLLWNENANSSLVTQSRICTANEHGSVHSFPC